MTIVFGFSESEKEVLKFWDSIDAFATSNKLSEGRKEYAFYDGPPFATGLPHYGHILSGTIKDTVTRFYYQQGYHVERKFGWDCHGLPIEYEIEKMYGIKTTQDIERIGVAQYNQYCREIVLRYSGEWEDIVKKMGRWIDFKNGYKTMDFSFMESVWSVFKELFDKGLVYRGYRVMPYSTRCRTPMSNFEANQNYKEAVDPAVTVALPLRSPLELGGKKISCSILVWTTTPWTLPSNCAVLVNADVEYAVVEGPKGVFIVSHSVADKYGSVLHTLKGRDLKGVEYTPPFSYFERHREKGYFRVYTAAFVEDGSGTGLVHCSPGFGEDDYNAFVANGLISENECVVCPVDDAGCFTEEVPDFAGMHVKDADKEIVRVLKERGVMHTVASIHHNYPFCWRSETPLIYKAVASWFVRVRDSVDALVRENKKIKWSPESVGLSKFAPWLENARDWSISRNRYWGTPIPIWVSGTGKTVCVGSAEELERLTGQKIADLHKDAIDPLVIVKDGEEYRRTPEVLDCWFESGSVPYAQKHYPFENREAFERTFPADFISEGLDQTRGWFYTLHILSVLLKNTAAFKNVMVTGLVLAADGKKMSKRLKNYPDPVEVMEKHGADALRLYLIGSPTVKAENLKFVEDGVKSVVKELLIPWHNCLRFYETTRKEAFAASNIEDIAEALASMDISSEEGEILDQWITHKFHQLCLSIAEDMGSYKLSHIVPKATAFVGDLSRWYIRLSRERLRGTSMPVLRSLLRKLSVLLSPFSPFFSEHCFQRTREEGDLQSSSFVLHSAINQEPGREMGFELSKQVIEGVRVLRERTGTQLKAPVKAIYLVDQHVPVERRESLIEIIKRECNTLAVESRTEQDYEWTEELVPDFKAISARRGSGSVKKVSETIRKIATCPEKVRALRINGHIEEAGVRIEREDVVYRRDATGVPKHVKGITITESLYVLMDTERDKELDEKWLQREVKSAVQKLRKRAGLSVGDKAVLGVVGMARDGVFCDINTRAVEGEVEGGEREEVEVSEHKVLLTLKLEK